MWCRKFTWPDLWGLLIGSLSIACGPKHQSIPSQPPLTQGQNSPRVLSLKPTLPQLSWTPLRTHITVDVRSSEKQTSQHDSAVRQFQVEVTPVRTAAGDYHAHFTTTSTETPVSTESAVFTLTSDGQLLNLLLPTNCTTTESMFSPAYARFFFPRYSLVWPVSGTLRYSSCHQRIRTIVMMIYVWQRPVLRDVACVPLQLKCDSSPLHTLYSGARRSYDPSQRKTTEEDRRSTPLHPG